MRVITNLALRLSIVYFLAEVLAKPDDARFAGKAIPARNLIVAGGLTLLFPILHAVASIARGGNPQTVHGMLSAGCPVVLDGDVVYRGTFPMRPLHDCLEMAGPRLGRSASTKQHHPSLVELLMTNSRVMCWSHIASG